MAVAGAVVPGWAERPHAVLSQRLSIAKRLGEPKSSFFCDGTSAVAGMIATVAAFGAAHASGEARSHRATCSKSAASRPPTQLQAISLLQRMLGQEKPQAERIDEEIADLRLQEVKDIAELRIELETRGPSEEDLVVEALRRKQEQIARLMGVRRSRAAAFRGPSSLLSNPSSSRSRPETPPAPWLLVMDIISGSWYYYNEETHVTSWELPRTTMVQRPRQPPAPWQLVPHASSGSWYFHNLATGITSWSAPAVKSARTMQMA
eukprot:CAMPEP_0115094214 /NCGR_PEP_ID=MMETSP0227-20121206/28179_1 /TAXON_ID=89957 /ORGANISM="Polarella glacialis, Strain CCMP 1383" /LENGTH=262 /DNA_ID=CAMNT_0002487083 /DNA_START=86 /DNA_END=874 /DNA_ORIENTATION=-